MLSEIRVLHLEMSERCNAACPLCARTNPNGDSNPSLSHELRLANLSSWLPAEVLNSLSYVYMCGNFGDPILARDTIPALRFLRKNSRCRLGMHTNGGARTVQWWTELADVMAGRGRVVFSVDGLEDTNHLYRRNVRWDVLQRNFRAYIQAGGKAEWHFLVFRHNEHQVETAQKIALAEGFGKFVAKKSARFANVPTNASGQPVVEPPLDPRYLNVDLGRSETRYAAYGGREGWLDRTPIQCKAKMESSLYISARGHLWPCCWLGYGSVPGSRKDVDDFMAENGGLEKLSLRNHSMTEILNGPAFNAIERGWSALISDGRLATCAKMCSKELDFFGAQYR
jgi:hypothetical protein